MHQRSRNQSRGVKRKIAGGRVWRSTAADLGIAVCVMGRSRTAQFGAVAGFTPVLVQKAVSFIRHGVTRAEPKQVTQRPVASAPPTVKANGSDGPPPFNDPDPSRGWWRRASRRCRHTHAWASGSSSQSCRHPLPRGDHDRATNLDILAEFPEAVLALVTVDRDLERAALENGPHTRQPFGPRTSIWLSHAKSTPL
jgi:hypothetical protein